MSVDPWPPAPSVQAPSDQMGLAALGNQWGWGPGEVLGVQLGWATQLSRANLWPGLIV